MPATIVVEGLDHLLGKIETLQQMRMVKAGIEAAALHVKGKIAQYPPTRRLRREMIYGSTFQSIKQQRYFFYALRTGKIEVPYRRGESPGSQTLGRRWTIAYSAGGLTATIGNNAAYGPVVQARDRQSLYHVGNWQTVEDVVEREGPQVAKFIQDEIHKAVNA